MGDDDVLATILAQADDDNNLFLVTSLVGVLIGGGIGFLIGNSKNRPVLGLVLGALLGCIGWIIVAIVPRKSPY
jgi:hypothetical protein